MARASAFSDCHPLVNLLFFALMLAVTMFVLHPVCLAVSLGGALACLVSLRGWRGAAALVSICCRTLWLWVVIPLSPQM